MNYNTPEYTQGMKFPFSFYAGKVSTSIDDNHIKQSILQIIGTSKEEYLFKPDFGSRLRDRIFDPVNVAGLVKIDVRDAVLKYEPRVSLIDVKANLVDSHLGVVNIIVNYTIKGRSELMDLNFYIQG